ncbi:MAG: extracellular solute-binding protein, partial [Armatimonadetes bacterium]|nr:extracellular solute-binding protein [Armatimonadota bacterium]
SFALGQWADAHKQIAAWIAAGKGPDLVVVPDIWIPEFADALEPYPETLPAAEKARFYPVLWEKGRYRGKVYGLVWATSTKALLYRRDLFARAGLKPPETWDDLLAAAKALSRPPDVYGIGIPAKLDYDTTDNFYFFLWSAGGDFFDSDGRVVLDGLLPLACMQWYSDLYLRHRVTQPSPSAWHRNECQRLFERGRLAMFETGPWAVAALGKHNPGLDYAVTRLPISPPTLPVRVGNRTAQVKAKPTRVTQVITDHLMLMRYSPNKDAALSFIRFAYQRQWRQRFCELGMVPELVEVGSSSHFQGDSRWKVFVDALADGKYVPLMRWEPVELALQQSIWSVFSGRWDALRACRHAAHALRIEVAADRAANIRPRRPWIRFVQITDPHYDTVSRKDAGKRKLTASRQLLANAVRFINEKLKPDFVVVTGDTVNNGREQGQLQQAATLLKSLQPKLYVVLGNHDGAREEFQSLFGPSLCSFDAGPLRFVVLSTYQGDLGPSELQFLRDDLRSHAGTPTVIFTHHSLLTLQEIKDAGGAGEPIHEQEALRDLLDDFPQVLAIVSGHHHINVIRPEEGILQVVSSALVEPPHEVHLFEMGPDGILLERYGLGDAAGTNDWQPDSAQLRERLWFDIDWEMYRG